MGIVKDLSLYTRAARLSLAAVRDKFFRHTSAARDERWFKQYDAAVPFRIDLPDVPLTHFLDAASREAARKIAMVYYNRKFSYRRLHDLAQRFAAGLQTLGVQPGDRVALCMPNIPQYMISYWATLYAGAVVVPINPLNSERELLHQLELSRARVLIVLDRLYGRVSKIRQQTKLTHVVVACLETYMPPLLNWAMQVQKQMRQTLNKINRTPDTIFFRQLLACRPSTVLAPIRTALPALLLFTGGVTGIAKAAMISHRNAVANTLQARAWIGDVQDRSETLLGVLPLSHSYGMTACHHLAVQSQATLVLQPRFDLKRVVRDIKKYRVTLFPGVPTMYSSVVHYARRRPVDLSSVRACISGGAALPVSLQAEFEKLTKGHLVEGYGLTEASPITHCNPVHGKRKFGSIGLPLPNTEARICDLFTQQPLSVGRIGEIQVRGPQIMEGYWQEKEETAAVRSSDGWLLTGDIGYEDEDGFFYVIDRKKEIIFSGGYNIYPSEVEAVLLEHPAVAEAAVVGRADAHYGAVVTAIVALKPRQTLSEGDLLDFCTGKLAKYKLPKKIVFQQELPKTILGKVLKYRLTDVQTTLC